MASINPFGGDTLPVADTTAVVKGSADATKQVRIEADGITTATTRVITMADQDIDLTPGTGTFAAAGAGGAGLVFLSSVTASASATVDLETTFDSTFDAYLIVVTGLVVATDATTLLCRLKLAGAYVTTLYRYHTHRMLSGTGSYSVTNSNNAAELTLATALGNDAPASVQLNMVLTNPTSTSLTQHAHWHGNGTGDIANSLTFQGGGTNGATGALTGVRFLAGSGNISSGTFRLYGITNS